jgi:phospholipase/carboxylesterase
VSEPLHAIIDRGPPDGPVLVLLHGRGSDERDLLPIGRMIHPMATTVSVRAPFEAGPWGYGPGFAWYRFLGGTTPDSETFATGQARLHRFMTSLPDLLGRSTSQTLLGGFSQGGTSSLAYLARNPGAVSGVLVFSGFVADHPSVVISRDRIGDTPIFWGHGTLDGAVPFENAEAGWARLESAGADLEAHSYPGLAHSINDTELRDAAAWAARVTGKTNGA